MIPRLQPGQELTPALVNTLIDGINSAQISSADFPIEQTTAGTRLSLPKKQEEFYAVITESPERYRVNGGEVVDGEYEWREVVLGEDGFEEIPDPEVGLGSHYDIPTRQLYNPAYELNDNRRLEVGRIVRMKPYPPIEDPNRGFLRRYIFSAVEQPDALNMWVLTMQRWSKAAGQPHAYVWVRQCDIAGIVVWGPYLRLWLPDAAGQQPNVIAGEVLAATQMIDGSYSCTSDYLDEQFGVVDWFTGTVADIRPGWQLADGTNGTADLSERFVVCLDQDGGPLDNGNENAIGETGGHRWHGKNENNHPLHAEHTIDNHAALVHNPNPITHTAVLASHGAHRHYPPGLLVAADSVGGLIGSVSGDGYGEVVDDNDGTGMPIPYHFVHVTWGEAWANNDTNNLPSLDDVASPGGGTSHRDHAVQTHTSLDNHPALVHGGVLTHLDHLGPYNGLEDTDNRPLFYVLAARERIDNSA